MGDVSEETCKDFRKIIRKVILPLTEALYKEEPEDLILFCSHYFNDLIKKREVSVKEDSSCERKDEFIHKDDAEGNAKANEIKETASVPSNVQGSISEPLLTSDKHCEGLSLRETTSWDVASGHTYSALQREVIDCNLADAMSRIGDQPHSRGKQEGLEEIFERDVKAGDTNAGKEKVFENDGLAEDETTNQTRCESLEEAEQNKHVLPSALSYQHLDENVKEVEVLGNSEGKGNCQQDDKNLSFQEKTDKASENLNSDASGCSTTDLCSSVRRNGKVFSKQLSPNSSFGFIPHIKEHDSEETLKSECSEDSNHTGKIIEELKSFTQNLSETLNTLAQEFNTAETNFNEEFQNAKEISDVIAGRHQAEEEEWEFIKKDSELIKNEEKEETFFKQSLDNNNNNLASNSNAVLSESKREKSPEKSLTTEVEGSKHEDTSYPYKYEYMERDAMRNSLKHQSIERQNLNARREEHSKKVTDTTLLQDEERSDDCKPDSYDSHQTIDESWRKRWYQSHPRLDNLNNGLQQSDSRFFWRHNAFGGYYPYETVHNVGEAGDVPSERGGRNLNERSNHSFGSNLESTSSASSLLRETASQGNLSIDEHSQRNTTGRATSSFPDSHMISNTRNIPSQNIPYSWRQMCRNQVGSSQNEAKRSKESQIKAGGAAYCGNEVERCSNRELHATHELGNLSEVVVEKEVKAIKEESAKDSPNMPCSKAEKNTKDTDKYDGFEENGRNDKKIDNEEAENEHSYPQSDTVAQSKDGFCQQNVSVRFTNATDEKFLSFQESIDADNGEKLVRNAANGSVDANRDGNECQRNDSFAKLESGLNSGCGDFVPPRNDENNNLQDLNSQSSNNDCQENGTNSQEPNPRDDEGVIADYFEEILGRVVEEEEDDFMDSSEYLQLDSYSESDKSSDISEPEEFNLNVNDP